MAFAAQEQAHRIRPIIKEDNEMAAHIIRTVLTEFGCTAEGFAIHDPEVDAMFETYAAPKSAYFVVEHDGMLVGGGGIAPLKGGPANTCELQKYYILPAYRGYGYGSQILEKALEAARKFGFKRCYLETMSHMDSAKTLYERNGFKSIDKPMGATGHFSCNRWYVKEM